MKTHYWILGLILIFFVGDRVAGFVLSKITAESQFRYSRMYTGSANADILLVGNSRGLIFYQPYIEELTGSNTFNFSYNGMPINLAQVLVTDYLEKYPPPKVMMLDVTMCDRLNDQLISGFNLYTPYSSRLDSLIESVNPTSEKGAALSHLFRYNSEIFQRSLFYLNRNDEDWLLDRTISNDLIENIDFQEPYQLIARNSLFKDTLLTVLNDVIMTVEKYNVKLVLIINPYYPPFANKIIDLATFQKEIEERTGKKVYNYSTAVSDPSGFGDYQHLNKYGAKLFIDLLLKEGLFTIE